MRVFLVALGYSKSPDRSEGKAEVLSYSLRNEAPHSLLTLIP